MNVWHKPYPHVRFDDVIFKRHECEWVLPLATAKFLKYNTQRVPAIIYGVKWWGDISGNYVHIIENSRSDYYYYRRVYAAYKGKEDVYRSNNHSVGSSFSCTYLSSDRSD